MITLEMDINFNEFCKGKYISQTYGNLIKHSAFIYLFIFIIESFSLFLFLKCPSGERAKASWFVYNLFPEIVREN